LLAALAGYDADKCVAGQLVRAKKNYYPKQASQ
jgi:hypothetical protein